MRVADQIPHFYKDKQGVSKRNMLQIEVEEASIQNGFPKDGTVMIRLQDEQIQKAFKMTVHEALVLGEHLSQIAKELLKQKRELWKNRGQG